MASDLHLLLARARAQDLRSAARGRGGVWASDPLAIPATVPVTLRYAFPDDAGALRRLAVIDCSEPPPGPVLLGEVGGQLLAAVSLSDGAVIADPFYPTVTLVELLRARARQLTADESAPRRPLRSIGAALRARLRLQSGR